MADYSRRRPAAGVSTGKTGRLPRRSSLGAYLGGDEAAEAEYAYQRLQEAFAEPLYTPPNVVGFGQDDAFARAGVQSSGGEGVRGLMRDFNFRRPNTAPKGDAVGLGRSGVAGLRLGSENLLGTLGDINQMRGDVAAYWAGKVFGATPETQESISNFVRRLQMPFMPNTTMGPTTEEIRKATNQLFGEPYQPQTTVEEYVRTIGESLPSAVFGPGRFLQRMVTQGLLPGFASEAAGQATEGTALEPYARIGAAMLTPMAASKRAVTPYPANEARLRTARLLENEGVELTAGQRTGGKRLRSLESEASRYANRPSEKQQEQFTRAVLRRAGIDASRATPEAIQVGHKRLDDQYAPLRTRHVAQPDLQFLYDNKLITRNHYDRLPDVAKELLSDAMGKIYADVNVNGIDGGKYIALRTKLGNLAWISKDSDQLSAAFLAVRDALDNVMERSVARTNRRDLEGWRKTRRERQNLEVVEQALSGVSDEGGHGVVHPERLIHADAVINRGEHFHGNTDYAKLARAGERILGPTWLPGSTSDPSGLLGTAASMIAGPFTRAILSRPVQAYLGNQLLAGAGNRSDPLLAALLAGFTSARTQHGPLGPKAGRVR